MKLFAIALSFCASLYCQLALPVAPLSNNRVEAMVRKGVPIPLVIQTILAAQQVDFLIDNYEFSQLNAAGASNGAADQILEAMHQRLVRGAPRQQAIDTTSQRAPVHLANEVTIPEVRRGPELVTQPIEPQFTLHRPGPRIILEDATPIRLRLSRNVSSADAKDGDTIDFEVLEQIKVQDRIIVPKGSIAWGTVIEAEAKRRMGRGGKLDVTIDSVRLADGEKAALRGSKQSKGGGQVGGMTTGIVVTSLVFWPAAPVFLLMQGKDITFTKGTEITAYTNGNTTLDADRFRYEEAPIPGP